jgi:hypothetical protein
MLALVQAIEFEEWTIQIDGSDGSPFVKHHHRSVRRP